MDEAWHIVSCVFIHIVRDETRVYRGWTLLITNVVTIHPLVSRCSHPAGQAWTDQAESTAFTHWQGQGVQVLAQPGDTSGMLVKRATGNLIVFPLCHLVTSPIF